jgi:tetratricopeptide (TPR) repeat protein
MHPELAAILARVTQREGVPPALLLGIIASMGASGKPDFSRIEHDLLRKASDYRALTVRLQKPTGQDADFDRLRAQAAGALAEGRLAEADRLLAQAEQRNLGSLAADSMSKERLLAAAAGRAERGTTAMLQLNPQAYDNAGARFAEAALIANSAEPGRGRVYDWMHADALARRGADFADEQGFAGAVSHLRGMLRTIDNLRESVDWAQTQLRLARSLTGLSHREGGGARLREAIAIYRDTLDHLDQKQAPHLWATIQTRLGEALARMGEARDDASLLEESVAAFRAGLSVMKRAEMPRDWARLQCELGKTYVALGQRASGAAALEAAINCFKLVLDVWTRETVPLDWAEVQERSGAALCALAEYYREPVVLEEAIAAFDDALKVRRRDTVPALWAETAANRAEALLALSERTGEVAEAKAAATELSAAIETLRGLGLDDRAKHHEPKLIRAGSLVQKLIRL